MNSDSGSAATSSDFVEPTNARAGRNRRIGVSARAAIAARASVGLVAVATVPLGIGHLGTERYGIWVALTSFASMLVFGDLGIGNGLVNVLSVAHARNDREAARRLVSAAVALVSVCAIAFATASVLLVALVPWGSILSARTLVAFQEATWTAAAFLFLVTISLPLSLIERIRLGYQEGQINSIWAIAGAVTSVAGLLLAIAANLTLPGVVLLTSGPPLLMTALNGVRLFGVDRKWLRPNLRLVDRGTIRELAKVGFLFLILQLAVAVAYQSDVLVAANVLGPDAAATYSVTFNLFMLAPSLMGLGLTVIWPAYTEAIARGDSSWVRQTLRRTIAWSLAGVTVVSLGLVLVSGYAIGLLTQGQIEPPIGLVIGMAIWAILRSLFNCIAILMNAATVVRFQVTIAVLMSIGSIGASYTLARIIGIEGIIWGTVVAYVLLAAIPTLLYLPGLLRQIDRAGVLTPERLD